MVFAVWDSAEGSELHLSGGHRAPAVAVSNLIARGSGAAADVHTLRMVLNDADLWEAPEKDGPVAPEALVRHPSYVIRDAC